MDNHQEEYEQAMNNLLLSQQMQSQESSMQWQLDPKDPLNEVELQLRGLEFREGKGLVRFRPEIINKQGIGFIKVMLRGKLNHSNVLAVIEKKEAAEITADTAHVLNDKLLLDGETWNVKDSDKDFIVNLVEDWIFLFLTRPVKGGERSRLSMNYNYSENQAPRRGLFSTFKRKDNQEALEYGS